jgi:hypothetical protein
VVWLQDTHAPELVPLPEGGKHVAEIHNQEEYVTDARFPTPVLVTVPFIVVPVTPQALQQFGQFHACISSLQSMTLPQDKAHLNAHISPLPGPRILNGNDQLGLIYTHVTGLLQQLEVAHDLSAQPLGFLWCNGACGECAGVRKWCLVGYLLIMMQVHS